MIFNKSRDLLRQIQRDPNRTAREYGVWEEDDEALRGLISGGFVTLNDGVLCLTPFGQSYDAAAAHAKRFAGCTDVQPCRHASCGWCYAQGMDQ